MTGFDTFVVVDWSARSAPSPAKPTKDAIWIGVARQGDVSCHYHRTRAEAIDALAALFETELGQGRRVVAGFDFPFAYPKGFARAVTGTDDPLALWTWLASRIVDAPDNANNRFIVARDLNRLFPGTGPFWGCPPAEADAVLPDKGTARAGHGLPERRAVEARVTRAQPCWKLFTTGSVGSQALLGLPRLQALRDRFAGRLTVAPFEAPDTPIVLVELFPSLIADIVAARREPGEIPDRAQVRVLAQALSRLSPATLDVMLRTGDPVEGWILGAGREDALRAAASGISAPPLSNDCFALPPGVDWTPVDEALSLLRDRLRPVVGAEDLPLAQASGRVLATDLVALRANPPEANTAVDGYGFAGSVVGPGPQTLPLNPGRAAAGVPFEGRVPKGHAIRVLTGAALPAGVDTVVLDEDTTVGDGVIAFNGPLKTGANTRKAGEDVAAGAVALTEGTRLGGPELALAAAVGHGHLRVWERLRVAVLSTGDEVVEPGADAAPGQIFDANRPMLLAMVDRFGFEPVDMGRVPDHRDALRGTLDAAADQAHVILTSGGASAGDEDHVSALLRDAGAMQEWRIALKPGRPLALGMWRGAPVFGLPGNPVAAFVCTLVFARPAMGLLAGEGWRDPQGFDVPAAFEKRKKPGRREYLRARIRDGRAEVFRSEGSGRVSGLSWAEGLVELPDGAAHVRPGDPVRYFPYGSFGL
ncbi:molybdopterin molybdenumtransferase MoeA [Thalassococcus sp. CAU 1522]|uniref:Molybdopterin molybdenumtransferase n=1 Tax=Thalassococcus arenae TaxID=2851652 RepID=A0ABS6N4X0_9RHOB|nr:gephyrin-like molybdotransferase Glp [Thalassococcus arenae]MBV2359041.1 molybdopterin molybdenumtransferase MoeA [Thalassococcus arenae]